MPLFSVIFGKGKSVVHYFKGRNRYTDVENRLLDTVGEGEGRKMQGVASTYIHSHRMASGKLLSGTGAQLRAL